MPTYWHAWLFSGFAAGIILHPEAIIAYQGLAMTRKATFLQSDITKAFRGAKAAGFASPRVEIVKPDGRRMIIFAEGAGPNDLRSEERRVGKEWRSRRVE